MLSDIGQRIKNRREELNMTQMDLAKALGYKSKSSINKIELGVQNLRQSKIKAIADALKTTPSYIMGWADDTPPAPVYSKCALPEIPPYDGISPVAVKRLPVLGSIACDEPIFMNEEMDIYVEVGANVRADFILKASGDSMINARIHDGDLVFIQSTPQVENGQIAAVAIGDEATLKRFYYYPKAQQICLQAENPVYAPMIFIGEQLEEVRVLGRAIAFQSDVR